MSPGSPLAHGGERLHEWMFTGKSAAESQSFETDHFSGVGALIMGRRMADVGIGPWGDEPTFHAPCFVVTPTCGDHHQEGRHFVHVVTEGIPVALQKAQQAAQAKDVLVNGGGDIGSQCLNSGVVDEIRLHLVPVVLGAGTRLFDGVRSDVRLVPSTATSSPLAPHLIYAVEIYAVERSTAR